MTRQKNVSLVSTALGLRAIGSTYTINEPWNAGRTILIVRGQKLQIKRIVAIGRVTVLVAIRDGTACQYLP